MANAAAKKLAQANSLALKQLHVTSVVVFSLSLALNWILQRRLTRFVVLSLPALLTEYIVETTCRPRYSGGQLVNTGQDAAQGGITEYLFDVIYLTWICAILSVFLGPKAWYLYLLAPLFTIYKVWGLLQAGKKLFKGPEQEGTDKESQPQLSKRQQKLSKRQSNRV